MTEIEKKGIGKAKASLVVCVVLIVILSISSIWLYTGIVSLQNQIDTLERDKSQLESQISDLHSEINWLNFSYDNYVATHHYTDSEYYEVRFSFYYVKPEQKYGVYNLSDWLNRWKWIKPYQEGVFDCSEMSAYLEWKLENEGWHTKIIVGDSPSGSGRGHAWLLVETSVGKYMPVESTNMAVVWWESPYFDNYFKYDHSIETIQDALKYNETEFDWWKG